MWSRGLGPSTCYVEVLRGGTSLRLKYGSIEDAKENLGPPTEIRRVFVEFQRDLYQRKKAA